MTVTATSNTVPHDGIRMWLDHAGLRVKDGTELVGGVCTSIEPGEVVAIIGASGAGKSTLLDLLAGNVGPTSGHVRINGVDSHALDHGARRRIGFVPQSSDADALPLRQSLFYAARLRLPAGSTADDARRISQGTLTRLNLAGSADVPVAQLSGGQKRRASIAVELLTGPDALLLDEPTSGLDPATGTSLMSELRTLADTGRTIVITTHHPDDLERCDRIIALAPTGRVSFDGTLADASRMARSPDPHRIHRALTGPDITRHPDPTIVTNNLSGATPHEQLQPTAGTPTRAAGSTPGRIVQWTTLTKRALAGIRYNRLTMGIMLGAPAAIITMFAVLFRTGSFDAEATSATPAIMIAFWVAFASFFFGLTYGLLQICPEIEAMRRERRAGVPAGIQIVAKMTALGPILFAINTAMLLVLRWLDRLPGLDAASMLELSITLALDALSALALGLLVSSLVRTPVQTSLALPMLCFPAVLFAGAMVPIASMTSPGRAVSAVIPVRWAFDSIGRTLGLRDLTSQWTSGQAGEEYATAWRSTTTGVWLTLAGFTVLLLASAAIALGHRVRPTAGHSR